MTSVTMRRAVRATWRVWVPFAVAALCLMSTAWMPPFAGFLAIVAGLSLIVEGFAVLAARGANLRDHRQ
jgi:hypothetical protein